jgi:hypothetical protein
MQNLIFFPTDNVLAFICHFGCLSVGQYTCLTTDKTLVSSEFGSMQFIHELSEWLNEVSLLATNFSGELTASNFRSFLVWSPSNLKLMVVRFAETNVGILYILWTAHRDTHTGVLISPCSTRKEKSYSDRKSWCSYILFIIIIGEILVLFIYIYNKTSIKRNILTIKKIHREVGRAKDLSAHRVI